MKSLFLGLIAAAKAPVAPPATVDARAHNQEARIQQGVRSGELNGAQAKRLQHGEAKIHRVENRMRARHGGQLTRHDLKKLTRMENHHSRAIAKAKTN